MDKVKVAGMLLVVAATLIASNANIRSYAAERIVIVQIADPQDAYVGVNCTDYYFKCCCRCCSAHFAFGIVRVTNNMDSEVYAHLENGRWKRIDPGETRKFITRLEGDKLILAEFEGGSARIVCHPSVVEGWKFEDGKCSCR